MYWWDLQTFSQSFTLLILFSFAAFNISIQYPIQHFFFVVSFLETNIQTSWWSVKKATIRTFFFSPSSLFLHERFHFGHPERASARRKKKTNVRNIKKKKEWTKERKKKKNHKINDHRDILTLFFFLKIRKKTLLGQHKNTMRWNLKQISYHIFSLSIRFSTHFSFLSDFFPWRNIWRDSAVYSFRS